MATFLQARGQICPPLPGQSRDFCPCCGQRQAQRAAPSPRAQALAHPATAHPGNDYLTPAHPDEGMSSNPGSGKER